MISNKTITFGDISFCPYCKQETLFKYGNAERQKNGGYVLRVINRTNDVSVEQGLIAWMKKEVEDVTSE